MMSGNYLPPDLGSRSGREVNEAQVPDQSADRDPRSDRERPLDVTAQALVDLAIYGKSLKEAFQITPELG
jgi:hypothetical protein